MFKGLTKDFIIYGIGSALSKLTSFLLLPFFTHYFTPEEYGALELIIITTTLGSILGLLQLESALTRFFYEYQANERKIYITSLLVFSGLLSLLITLILWVFAEEINQLIFNENTYIQAYKIGILSLPLLCLNSFFIVVIRFTSNRLLFIKAQSILFLTSLIIPVILVLYFNFKLESYFWGQLSGLFLSVGVMTLGLKNLISKEVKFDFVKSALNYSVPLIPAVFSGWVNSYGSRFLMLSFLSLKEIGLYAVSIKIASVFQLFGEAFRMTWPQFFWKTFKENENHKTIFKEFHSVLSALITIVLVVFTSVIGYFTQLFLDVEYHNAALYIPIISFSFVLLSFITQIVGLGASVRYKTQYNSYAFIFGTLVNLVCLLIFLPNHGLIAVPIALLVGSTSSLMVLWYFSEKFYPIGFSVKTSLIHFSIVLINSLIGLVFALSIYQKISLLLVSIAMTISASNVLVNKIKNVIK